MQRARSEVSKENRKQFILDKAEQLIFEEGLARLSIGRVSKKSKLAVGTIYLYFESKEDIIAHLTIKSREILLQRFKEQTEKTDHSIEKIKNLLLAFYFFYKEKPFYNQLVSFYETNSGLQETQELKEASDNITKFVITIIKEGKEKNLIKSDINESAFSFWLWGTTVGIIQLLEVKSNLLNIALKTTELEFFNTHIYHVISTLK